MRVGVASGSFGNEKWAGETPTHIECITHFPRSSRNLANEPVAAILVVAIIATLYSVQLKPGGEFDVICLKPFEYAAFDCLLDAKTTRAQAHASMDELYWDGWLKNNLYESMIETTTSANTPGIAGIEAWSR